MSVLDAVTKLLRNRSFTFWTFKFRFWGIKRMSKYTYFTDDEVKGLDQELCAMLDRARGIAGVPFIITSGLRTVEANSEIPDAVKDSSHLSGNAVDLACTFSQDRFRIMQSLFDVGFVRIGIYRGHIHADNSQTLPQNVMWYSSNE